MRIAHKGLYLKGIARRITCIGLWYSYKITVRNVTRRNLLAFSHNASANAGAPGKGFSREQLGVQLIASCLMTVPQVESLDCASCGD